MKTILMPVDFSPTAERAVAYVESVFHDQPIQLRLIYVLPVSEADSAKVDKQFNDFEAAQLSKFTLPYTFTKVSGNILDSLKESITQLKPFLVILGTNKSNLAKSLVKLTDSPILVIPEHSNRNAIKNIAYANDFNSIKASEALEPLLNLSRSFNAKVHILHVSKDNVLPNDEAEASIEYYLDHVDHEYVSIRTNDFVKTIQQYLKDQDIDLLTILIRDHGQNDLHSDGSLIEQLVATTSVPVLSLV